MHATRAEAAGTTKATRPQAISIDAKVARGAAFTQTLTCGDSKEQAVGLFVAALKTLSQTLLQGQQVLVVDSYGHINIHHAPQAQVPPQLQAVKHDKGEADHMMFLWASLLHQYCSIKSVLIVATDTDVVMNAVALCDVVLPQALQVVVERQTSEEYVFIR